MFGKRFVAALVLIALATSSSPSFAQPPAAADEAELWHTFLLRLDAATPVSIRLKNGSRMKGVVLDAGDEAFMVKPKTRIPVAARQVRYDDVATIEPAKVSMSPGKKMLLGVGIGSAVYMLGVALLFAAGGYD
jgi:hypothetical protein